MSNDNTHFHYTGEKPGRDIRDNIEVVTIDSNITTIGKEAFSCCKKLKSVTIPNNITNIKEMAFMSCSALTSITIPSKVKCIGKRAFKYCENLQTINIESSNISTIHQRTFFQCTSLRSITLPPSVQTIKRFAFQGCEDLTTINISPTTNIEPKAFRYCRSLDQQSIQRLTPIPSFTLKESFQQGPGPTRGFQGATQKGYGPEWWGVTLEQIEALCKHPLVDPDRTTMREVVDLIIKPITKELGVGYALLLNQDQPLHANVMVSVSPTTHSQSIVSFSILH